MNWKMRDGTEIAVEDMSDSHLMNTYKMVARSIPPSTLWAGILKDELKHRGLHHHPNARLPKDSVANVWAMAEAEYSTWQDYHDGN